MLDLVCTKDRVRTMTFQTNGHDNKQFLTFRKIKWATVTIPVIVLATLDWMRHNLFFTLLHSLPGFIGTYLALGVGVTFFSYTIFGLIERLQRQNNERNRQ